MKVKRLVTRSVEQQVQVTAVCDDALRAKAASGGITEAAADEPVRINARAGEQAPAVSVTGMAVTAFARRLVARRVPVPAGAGAEAGAGPEPPPPDP
ncbi:hypothetical protein AQJ66_27235 [Streptomyces bungoensis]|uniref:Uncharacterized protein n=1 Tax=Streptomyces bungoensis TaxID=285568 RepID=A0A101STN7_9ACTN|nr:hypothetical protein AQJ66_27235 [Streptomyces bungoensis]